MKKNDVELVINTLKDIKCITDKLDFKTSSHINQLLIKIMPIMENEVKRLDDNNIEITCPKLLILDEESVEVGQTMAECINIKLTELVQNGFKIIDFGMYDIENYVGYIKYTA